MPVLDNAYALVVGIDDGYQQVWKLPPTRDAQAIAELLTNEQEGGYPKEHVMLLRNAEATKAALTAALADLAKETNEDSVVFIYFSGHGWRIEEGEAAGEYLVPVDADPASDVSIAKSSISGDAFTAALDALPARQVVVIFDCCHAGGVGALKSATKPIGKPGLPDAFYDRLAGRAIYASSRDSEFSLVFPSDENGLFTKHLLAGLRGGVPSPDGLVYIFDLIEYVGPLVVAAAAAAGEQQTPFFKLTGVADIPIAMRLGGQPEARQGYDAFISYVDGGPDAAWVRDTLKPKLQAAGLDVALAGASGDPAAPQVVNDSRGIKQAQRTIAVVSDAYLDDERAAYRSIAALAGSIASNAWRLILVNFAPFDKTRLPDHLTMFDVVDLSNPQQSEGFERLVTALQKPPPVVTEE